MTRVQLLIQLVTVCCHLGKTDVDGRSVWRFMFIPGHELLRMFPAKKKEGPQRPQPRSRALLPVQESGTGEETEMSTFVRSA